MFAAIQIVSPGSGVPSRDDWQSAARKPMSSENTYRSFGSAGGVFGAGVPPGGCPGAGGHGASTSRGTSANPLSASSYTSTRTVYMPGVPGIGSVEPNPPPSPVWEVDQLAPVSTIVTSRKPHMIGCVPPSTSYLAIPLRLK